MNLLLHHGVRACLEYQRSGDAESARRASNPDLAPHVSFLDMGGHGYATLHLTADAVECEFVCIPRPLERSPARTEGRSAIASSTACRCGARASGHTSSSASSKAIPGSRFETGAGGES